MSYWDVGDGKISLLLKSLAILFFITMYLSVIMFYVLSKLCFKQWEKQSLFILFTFVMKYFATSKAILRGWWHLNEFVGPYKRVASGKWMFSPVTCGHQSKTSFKVTWEHCKKICWIVCCSVFHSWHTLIRYYVRR